MVRDRSPFSPGRPVPLELFVGRQSEIDLILRAASQVAAKKQENIFITGEYGIGKSSLAALVGYFAKERYQLANFHVFLGGAANLEEMAEHVMTRVIRQIHHEKLFDKVKSFLGKYVQELDLFGVKFNLEAIKQDVPGVAHEFLPFLQRVYGALRSDYKGITLILDELNGIAEDKKFAYFLKGLVDEIATGAEPLPLLLILVGVPERRETLIKHQKPIERIFTIAEINPLDQESVRDFFCRAYESVEMQVAEEATQLLIQYSGGLPKLMHELGDATFWVDQDGIISREDANKGVVMAADSVGKKYFDPVYRALRSSDYHSILRKLGQLNVDLSFHKEAVVTGLTSSEKNKFNNFLQRMKKLNVLTQGETKGKWVFPNRLVRLYLTLEAIEATGASTGRR